MKQEKEQVTTSAVALDPVKPMKAKKRKYKDFDVPTERTEVQSWFSGMPPMVL